MAMNVQELRQSLIESGVPSDAYHIGGGLPNESLCIENCGDKWRVYYSERGLRTGLKEFATEESACRYFFELIVRSYGQAKLLRKPSTFGGTATFNGNLAE